MAKATLLLRQSACAALRARSNLPAIPRAFSTSRRRLASSTVRRRHANVKGQNVAAKPQNASAKDQNAPAPAQADPPSKPPKVEDLLAHTDPKDNPLLAPVHIPEDTNAVLKSDHPATDILTQSAIVVQRQIEMMNIFLGFEQANCYIILDPQGNHIGYMAEHDGGIGHSMKRQFFNTHRAFTTHVFDRNSREVLRFHRPFSWINTRIRVYDPWDKSPTLETSPSTAVSQSNADPLSQQQISPMPLEAMRIIGETHSQWAPLRRKYDLFLSHNLSLDKQGPGVMSTTKAEGLSSVQQHAVGLHNSSGSTTDFAQFARVDEQFLSWDFSLRDADSRTVASVNREFRGFGREIFTDTGSYVLKMDAVVEQEQQASTIGNDNRGYAEALGGTDDKFGLTLDQRAVMLATAVTIDYDYFSRHSGSGGHGFFPLWMMGGGGEAAGGAGAGAAGAGAAEAGAAEAGGAVIGGAGRAVGTAAGSAGVGEGAMAGAGTMAGYEAMQRGMGRGGGADDASPQAPPAEQPYDSQSPQSGLGEQGGGEDTWGTAESDPWSEAASTGGAGSGGGGEGGGWLSQLWDSFFDS